MLILYSYAFEKNFPKIRSFDSRSLEENDVFTPRNKPIENIWNKKNNSENELFSQIQSLSLPVEVINTFQKAPPSTRVDYSTAPGLADELGPFELPKKMLVYIMDADAMEGWQPKGKEEASPPRTAPIEVVWKANNLYNEL